MNKILLALQFWDGDKRRAMEVARLVADLEPKLSERADFLFVARFDCTHNLETINYVSQKFHTHHYVNRNRRGSGWPHGCNELMFGTMDWVFSHSEAKRIPDYKAVLLMEADSCPLHPNWISQLSQEWDAAKVKVYGPLLDHGPHINGNCMMSGDMTFLKWLTRTKGGCSPHGGWDFLLYNDFKKLGCANARSMRSWWRCATVEAPTYESLLHDNVCFLHGCKDDSLIRLVRQKFNLP